MSANYKDMNILLFPVITEKSYGAKAENNQYVFKIAKRASKADVKQAVETIFEVKVEKIQVITIPGKERRRGAHVGKRPGYRKAVVRLAEGQSIDPEEEA
ncbi:MAG: 50S ribosomal protein L23 [Mariprofundaceae bacterium]|nr:50S ribosomal protein L23 [Mariprofundaceae bacterium]